MRDSAVVYPPHVQVAEAGDRAFGAPHADGQHLPQQHAKRDAHRSLGHPCVPSQLILGRLSRLHERHPRRLSSQAGARRDIAYLKKIEIEIRCRQLHRRVFRPWRRQQPIVHFGGMQWMSRGADTYNWSDLAKRSRTGEQHRSDKQREGGRQKSERRGSALPGEHGGHGHHRE